MPPIRYYNQTGPFWDFVASLEEQGGSQPLFGGSNNNNNNEQRGESSNNNAGDEPTGPFWGPWGPFAHRGRHHGPPPPPAHDGPSGPPPPPADNEGDNEPGSDPEQPQHPHCPGQREHEHHRGRHGHHGGPHGRRGHCGGRGRSAWGGRGRRGGHFPYHMMGPFGPFAEAFTGQLYGNNASGEASSEDFQPDVDVFDTAEAFVVHVSLAGAKKEDVGVSWNAEKSELSVAGVIHRPGDEDFLKTLAMGERKVGAFERKVRLGSRANPAQVDVDAITARMEEGVLRIEVPKLDAGYVEIKKVDIE